MTNGFNRSPGSTAGLLVTPTCVPDAGAAVAAAVCEPGLCVTLLAAAAPWSFGLDTFCAITASESADLHNDVGGGLGVAATPPAPARAAPAAVAEEGVAEGRDAVWPWRELRKHRNLMNTMLATDAKMYKKIICPLDAHGRHLPVVPDILWP